METRQIGLTMKECWELLKLSIICRALTEPQPATHLDLATIEGLAPYAPPHDHDFAFDVEACGA